MPLNPAFHKSCLLPSPSREGGATRRMRSLMNIKAPVSLLICNSTGAFFSYQTLCPAYPDPLKHDTRLAEAKSYFCFAFL